ncbi:hypothetical protein CAPTEDRAFT_223283 [Capitella teleta]|uniref:EF-hand domain-containing protein n=1 Tax=Capitella teleta TaxID=283909 RepID=R7V649_CAPTE|nr:hypothetical protein CAPTEDRAFT_223283 [Capitella teleta]|eukprot:ELU13957.1 hypothetical protein CAPTEDRAFT_223283 [Capitella teleta]
MVARKIPKEVQAIFDRYVKNNVRRLAKDEAIAMLEKEFSLAPEQANAMFESFDGDHNGIMSLYEFQQFYQCVGNSAQEMVKKFEELDADGSGKLDVEEAKVGLQASGLGEKEIDFFINSTKGKDGQIDIAQFGNLLFRLKVYEEKSKKKKK